MSEPILYIKPNCPWCVEVVEYLKRARIRHETVNVTADRAAMQEMIRLSGQSKAPTMDWGGQILADFGVEELVPFLETLGVIE